MGASARRSVTFRNVTKPTRGWQPSPLAVRFHPVTIWPKLFACMPPVVSELEWAVRLSGQLETLSELAESLTYRLLELEERLGAQDRQLSSLATASEVLTTEVSEAIEERMQETEDRLARIEGLLHGAGSAPRALRALRALTGPSVQSVSSDEEVVFLDDLAGDLAYPDDSDQGDFHQEEDSDLEADPFDEDRLDQVLAG